MSHGRFLHYSITSMFNSKGGVKGNLEDISKRLEGIEKALNREGYEIPQRPDEKDPLELETNVASGRSAPFFLNISKC